jgi:hypothetical protein
LDVDPTIDDPDAIHRAEEGRRSQPDDVSAAEVRSLDERIDELSGVALKHSGAVIRPGAIHVTKRVNSSWGSGRSPGGSSARWVKLL